MTWLSMLQGTSILYKMTTKLPGGSCLMPLILRNGAIFWLLYNCSFVSLLPMVGLRGFFSPLEAYKEQSMHTP